MAGSTVVAAEAVSVTTADLHETGELEFISYGSHTDIGEPLSIKLSVTSTDGWNDRGQIDNIKVYAMPIPPAGTIFRCR